MNTVLYDFYFIYLIHFHLFQGGATTTYSPCFLCFTFLCSQNAPCCMQCNEAFKVGCLPACFVPHCDSLWCWWKQSKKNNFNINKGLLVSSNNEFSYSVVASCKNTKITLLCPLLGSLATYFAPLNPTSLFCITLSLSQHSLCTGAHYDIVMTASPALRCTQPLWLFWWFTASSSQRQRGELNVHSKYPRWHLHRFHPTT